MNKVHRAAKDDRVTIPMFAVLAYLAINPDASMDDVCHRFGRQKSWYYKIITSLEKIGYGPEAAKATPVKKTPAPPPPTPPNPMKWVDPLTTNNDDYELIKFYLSHNHPKPEGEEQLRQAALPGMMLWARVTNNYVGWVNAPTINKAIGKEANVEALKTAWLKWNSFGYRKQNISGILDWYKELALDEKAEPWNNRRSNDNRGRTNGISREHGESKTEIGSVEFGTVPAHPLSNNRT